MVDNNLSDSLEEKTKSISTDSLETVGDCNESSDSSSNNLIPFYLGEVAKKSVKHLSNNVKNNQESCNNDRLKTKRNHLKSIHHATCHLDTATIDRSSQVSMHSANRSKVGLQRCLKMLEQKKKATRTYLEIFQKKMQIKQGNDRGKSSIDTARSIWGDLTPPKLSDDDLIDSNMPDDWDSSSFYIKFLEDKEQHNFNKPEAKEGNNKSDGSDASILNNETQTELCSISDNHVVINKQPVLKNINNKYRMVSPKLTGFGSNFNSVKKKLELYQKQREYGQNCSNRNRVKIIHNKSKSQSSIVTDDLSAQEMNKLPISFNRAKLPPIRQEKIENPSYHPRLKSFHNNMNDSLKANIENSNKNTYGAQHKRKMIALLQRDILKNLQDRHERDQKLIHEIRNITTDSNVLL